MTRISGSQLNRVLLKYPWYKQVWNWYCQGYISEQEVIDALNYLDNFTVAGDGKNE